MQTFGHFLQNKIEFYLFNTNRTKERTRTKRKEEREQDDSRAERKRMIFYKNELFVNLRMDFFAYIDFFS